MGVVDDAPDQARHDHLVAVLEESQRLGFLGDRPITEVVDHARAFVDAVEPVSGRVVDIGSGGGVPGLVIACDRPDLHLVLVDRRATRTDFLSRVVRRLRWADRVSVLTADVAELSRHDEHLYDAVVARGFGPPDETLRAAAGVVRQGGMVVISEPPCGDRWDPESLAAVRLERRSAIDGRVAVFRRSFTVTNRST